MTLDIVVFALYMVVVFGISVWTMRFMKNISDFLLAGRRLGPWVSSFSGSASLATGYTYTGGPGVATGMGWAAIWWTIPEGLGMVLNFGVLGRRVRRMGQLLGALTVPDFLYRRTGHQSVRISSALIILVFISVYTGVQFAAAGRILQGAFGLDYTWGVVLTAVSVCVMLVMGGYLAASLTDFFQATLMWGGTALVIIIGLVSVGGLGAFNDRLGELDPNLVTLFRPDFGPLDAGAAVMSLAIGLLGLPHILTRLYSMRSDRIAGGATLRNGLYWSVFGLYFLIGLLALVILGDAISHPEMAAVELWMALLPAGLAGLLTAAAIAAIFSSADSFLMVLVGSVIRDVLQPYVLKDASQDRLIRWGRAVVIGLTVLGGFFALTEIDIFGVVVFAVGAMGLAFGIPHILAIFWSRLTWQGLLSGQVIGVATFVWLTVAGLPMGTTYFASFGITTLLMIGLSLLTFKGLSPEMAAVFERSRAYDRLGEDEGEDLEGTGTAFGAQPRQVL